MRKSNILFVTVVITALLIPAGFLVACMEPETISPPSTATPKATVNPTPGQETEPASDYKLTYVVVYTGQDKCYDNTRVIADPPSSSAFYGQDAQYQGAQPNYRDNKTMMAPLPTSIQG